MDVKTTGATPHITGGEPPQAVGKQDGGRGLIIALAACWLAAGLYVAPLATLLWLACVGGIVALAWWLAARLDDRIYHRVANGRCAQCGHDLRRCGPSGDCPACGAWFGPGWGATVVNAKAGPGPETPAEGQTLTSSPQTATAPAGERKSP